MADKVTVTSRHSYGSRVKNSFGKIGWWLILVIASIFFIFKNEQNFLQTKVALNEWAEVVQETVSTEINPSLDGAEVHLYWETSSPAEALQDPTFGIITDDLKLEREVSMYQWIEESQEKCTDNLGWSETCETTYSYSKWRKEYAIDSSNFYEVAWHENPSTWKYESEEREKSPILVWVYTLSDIFVSNLSNYKILDLTSQDIIVPQEYKTNENSTEVTQETTENNAVENNNDSYLYWDNEETEKEEENTSSNNKFSIHDDYIYIGNETSPQVWDLKITFYSVKTWTISVIWQQNGDTLTSYIASNWKSIALLNEWKRSAEEMFAAAQQKNKATTWFFRCLLLVIMFRWFSMMLEFITTLAKVVPLLSRVIGVWTKTLAFALTLIFGFLAIWISRLAVRPVIWISCLVVVVIWIVMLVKAKKNRKAEKWNDTTKKDEKDLEIIEA